MYKVEQKVKKRRGKKGTKKPFGKRDKNVRKKHLNKELKQRKKQQKNDKNVADFSEAWSL